MVAGLQILSSGFLVTLFTENYRAIPHLGGLPDSSEVLLTCQTRNRPFFLKGLYIAAFWAFQFAATIADLNYAVYSKLGIFLHTIWHNRYLKVTPTKNQDDTLSGTEDYELKHT